MLYGTRYLIPGKFDPDLPRIVESELPYLDYQTTLEFYDTLSDEGRTFTKEEKAFLGCNDRFFLLTKLLRRPDALHPWIFDRCREIEAAPDGHLDLWARYHYKSTLGTFAGPIQEIIRNPEITISIFSHTKDIARAFLSQVMQELEVNADLKAIYPDVFFENPKNDSTLWSKDDGIVCKRAGNPREATIEAWGLVDAQPTGKHFMLLIYDDVVVPKSVTTPEMVDKTTKSWELSDNLGVGEATRKWHFGTRYSHGDTYQELIDRGILKVRLYPATHNGKKDGIPVFLSKEQWRHVCKTQSRTLAAQMLQNPSAGTEAMFDVAWFKPYEVRPTLLNVYITVDPSGGKKKTSDRTAMSVIGVDVHRNKYFLDGYRHRMKLSERWERLKGLWQRWNREPGVQFVFVGYEKYGMQSDLEYFEECMQRERLEFPIEELNWSGPEVNSKTDRVRRLQPDIEGTDSKLYFPDTVYYPGIGHCRWAYNQQTNQIDYTACEVEATNVDKLVSMRMGEPLLTKDQQVQVRVGTPWRNARAIKKIDETGVIYDLTLAAFQELGVFPHRVGHDDLADAMSRLYDMNPQPPQPTESVTIKAPEWRDR